MLTAGRVIEAARDAHPAFDRKRSPDKIVLRFLASYQRELAGKVAAIDETLLVTDEIVLISAVDFEAGITLPANRYVAGVTAKDVRSTAASPQFTEVKLIPWAHRHDRNSPLAAAWQYGGKLYLRSPASAWANISEIGISLVAAPGDLDALADVLVLPDEAEKALRDNTALFLAKRGHTDPGLPAIPINDFRIDAERSELEYLRDVANRLTANTFRTRDVWP